MKQYVLAIVCLFLGISAFSQKYSTDFESQAVGTAYIRSLWQEDGFTTASWDQGLSTRTMVDNTTAISGTKSLRVTYPANTYGPTDNGAQIPLLVDPVDELYMSYWIRFSENFTWGTTSYGGKIPGIAGGGDCSGGEYCDGTNGFSCRFMWRAGGQACLYLYDMTKESYYGEDHYLIYPNGTNVVFVPGTWYHIAERVKINSSSSSSDGEVEAWVNGQQVLMLTGRQFVTNDDKADKLYISTFHGGSDDTWCPTETCYIWFDDITISTDKNDVMYQECSTPQGGIDRTLCGEDAVTLDSHISNESSLCSWIRDGEVVATGKTFTTNEAGTYIISADSSGCVRKDTVRIFNTLQPNLGEDAYICEQSYETLDARIAGKAITYTWYKDGDLLPEKTRTLTTKEAGTYMVTVSAPNCSSASDEVTIQSGLIDIPDIEATENQEVTLTVTNPDETIYDWYDDVQNGTLVHSGSSFTTTAENTTKTYYVADRNGMTTLIGKPKIVSEYSYTYAPADEDESKERRMKFEVFKTLTIDSVTMTLCGTQDLVVNIYTDDNTTRVFTKTFPDMEAGNPRIALGVTLEPGVYYMGVRGSTGRVRYSHDKDSDIQFPYTIDGVISLLGSNIAWINAKPYYLFFYNWRISTGNHCARTPASIIVSNAETKTLTIELRQGWNLMSINLHPSDSSIATLFSGLDVDLIKDDAAFWKKGVATPLQSLSALSAGKGYLVYMNKAGTLSVSGTPMHETNPEKKSGWTLTGFPQQAECRIESLYDANTCQMLKNLNGTWERDESDNTIESVGPGDAYFIK